MKNESSPVESRPKKWFEGVHGITVVVYCMTAGQRCQLGSGITNADGRFQVAFMLASNKGAEEPIQLELRDRNGIAVHSLPLDEAVSKMADSDTFQIALPSKVLLEHTAKPLSWGPPPDAPFPQSFLSDIAQAVDHVMPALRNGGVAGLSAWRLPPVLAFDAFSHDAWNSLQGCPAAAKRFRRSLEVIHDLRASVPNSTISGLKRLFIGGDILMALPGLAQRRVGHVSKEYAVPLLIAAIHASQGDRAVMARYLATMFDQLCQLERLGEVHDAAVSAFRGGTTEKAYFRGLCRLWRPDRHPGGAGLGGSRREAPLSPDDTHGWWDDGDPIPGPDDGPIPDFPPPREDPFGLSQDDFATLREFDCIFRFLDSYGGKMGRPYYTIDSISPAQACHGDIITITGNNFNEIQGLVLFHAWEGAQNDWVSAEILSWTDTAIIVRVPEHAGHGLRLEPAHMRVVRICGRFTDAYDLPIVHAEFEGTAAEVSLFQVNNQDGPVLVEPGSPVTIAWETHAAFADGVRVELLDDAGAVLASADPADALGSLDFTQTNYNSTAELTARITARGNCIPPSSQHSIQVWVYEPPQLSIIGIEVTQATQRFNITGNTSQNNSVILAGGKRTIVRAYTDSGRTSGFDAGAGSNIQPDITGTMTVTNLPIDQQQVVERPLNAMQCISQPALAMDRNNLDHSLNFEIPIDLIPGWHPANGMMFIEQTVRVRVEVETRDPVGNVYRANNEVDVTIRDTQPMKLILIPCSYGGILPTAREVGACIEGARTRLPVADYGLPLYELPNPRMSADDLDLSTHWGWLQLMLRLEMRAVESLFTDQGYTWCAIVPPNGHYNFTDAHGNPMEREGMGTDAGHMRLACRGDRPASFAHELCHTRGIDHSACGTPTDSRDDRLAGHARLSETGVDVHARPPRTYSPGTGDLMGYCDGQDRWPTVGLWNLMRDIIW